MSAKMVREEKGFTLVELLIAMAVFVISLILVSNFFTGQLTLFKQQSKLAESNIEGIIGLDILRRDMESAGYGLPWDLTWNSVTASYSEAVNDTNTPQNETSYNDSTSNPPRALVSGRVSGWSGSSGKSDVLVVKAVSVATNNASQKWTHLFNGNTVTKWTPTNERLVADDRVIVISPGSTGASRILVLNGTSFTSRYVAQTDPANDSLSNSAFAPADTSQTNIVYGVTSAADPVTTALRMPFNRADYYIRQPSSVPSRCAPETGILYKATVNQDDGAHTELPLLDCALDMRVVYLYDDDLDGTIDHATDDISGFSASDIRAKVKEVRVYVLAHEGQRDPNFIYPNSTVTIGESFTYGIQTYDLKRTDNFSSKGVTGWQNYRWKVYTIVARPNNLGRKLSTS